MRKKKDVSEAVLNRRRESRVNEEDKVVVEILSDESLPAPKRVLNALTKDISPGGVRVIANIEIPVNTQVRLEIVLSKRRRRIQVTGIVRWARSIYEADLFEMGVEFLHISPEDRMNLLEHTYKRPD
jgi:c-di-GMP-binding flagellar brake protein YcgR